MGIRDTKTRHLTCTETSGEDEPDDWEANQFTPPETLSEMLSIIEERNITFVSFEAPDINGVSCQKLVAKGHVETCCTAGLNFFCGFSLFDVCGEIPPNSCYFKDITFADGLFFPVYRTFRFIKRSARVLCELSYSSGRISYEKVLLETHSDKTSNLYRLCGEEMVKHLQRNPNHPCYRDKKAAMSSRPYPATVDSEPTNLYKCQRSDDLYKPRLTCPIDSRAVARVQASRLNELGYALLTGFEYEFFLIDETNPRSFDDYPVEAPVRFARTQDMMLDPSQLDLLHRCFSAINVNLLTFQTEYGRFQHEVTFRPAFDIRAADDAYTFRTFLKQLLPRHTPYKPSFMTKPYSASGASGCHVNQSLWRIEANGNCKDATADSSRRFGLSEVAEQFIAGQLRHMSALTALLAPDGNSYRRFKPNSFAPTTQNWGIENRTAAIRVKTGENTYWENRVGCAPLNPYLAYAACVAAGIDGIKSRRKLEEPVTHNTVDPGLFQLPRSHPEALKCLEDDTVIRDALGWPLISEFVGAKRHECRYFRNLEEERKYYLLNY